MSNFIISLLDFYQMLTFQISLSVRQLGWESYK